MNEENIGKFISEMRKKKGMTQRDLSKAINVTDKAVSKWETGKGYPDISILIPLSDILGISVNELLLGEKIKKDSIAEESVQLTIKLSQISINKWKRHLIYIVSSVVMFLFFILYLSGSMSPIGVLEILTILIILLMVKFKKSKSKVTFISIFFLTIYTFYSFFTFTGSVRLEVVLMGHPIKAYTSDIVEVTYKRSYDERYYNVLSDIQVTSGQMGLIKCQNFYGFKISSYYGF